MSNLVPSAVRVLQLASAGLVPFAVAPATEQVYLLLGQEKYERHYQVSSCKWCEFGGRVEGGERAVECAAREFVEESSAVVRWNHEPADATHSQANLLADLLQKRFSVRLSVELPPLRRHRAACSREANTPRAVQTCEPGVTAESDSSGANANADPAAAAGSTDSMWPSHWRHARVVYVKQIPWQPDAPARFTHVRQKLLHAKTLLERAAHTCRQMTRYVRQGNVYRHGAVLFSPHAVWSECVARLDPEVRRHPALRLVWNDGTTTTTTPTPTASARSSLVNVYIDNHYLEKQQLRWWSLPQLNQVLQQHGQLHDDHFRDVFVLVLRVLLPLWGASPWPALHLPSPATTTSSAEPSDADTDADVAPWVGCCIQASRER